VYLPISLMRGIEDVFSGRGQVHVLVVGESALIARKDEQRTDGLAMILGRAPVFGFWGSTVRGRSHCSSVRMCRAIPQLLGVWKHGLG
jgi:hypothetical protein